MVEKGSDTFQNSDARSLRKRITVNSAIGGSTNAPIHLNAIARQPTSSLILGLGNGWTTVPLLVNLQPAGEYLGEAYHQAGGVPAVMHELLKAGKLHGKTMTVAGTTVEQNCSDTPSLNSDVIKPYAEPMMEDAGFVVLKGNVCDAAIMKTSVISDEFRKRYLSNPGQENVFEVRAIVFDGPEDYHKRINDPLLNIDAYCILVIRGCGPVGYPGSAEVVNMQPPNALIRDGIRELPTLGDGRQSGLLVAHPF
ncbi:MAG: hypothetical protein CM1200mP18_09820 [Gammaproteobacteria bacterium]|nr:MAG: hypothetical protein CM1200mP18_09820 [Gammaproteobacteria bacterium]